MPIDASIPLQARAPQIQPFNPAQAYLTLTQLRQQQQALQQQHLALQQAQQTLGERARLRDLLTDAARPGTPALPATPGTPSRPAAALAGLPLSSIVRPGVEIPGTFVEPGAATPALPDPRLTQGARPAVPGTPAQPGQPAMSFEELDRRGWAAAPSIWPAMRKDMQGWELDKIKLRSAQRDDVMKALEYGGRYARLIPTLPEHERQGAYMAFLATLRQGGFPMENAPKDYTTEFLQHVDEISLSTKDKLDLDIKRKEQEFKAGKYDYGLGHDLNAEIGKLYGAQLGTNGRPTSEMLEHAQQNVEARRLQRSASSGLEAAKITATQKPLEGAVAKEVGDLSALLAQHADVSTLYKPDYVGPIRGRTGTLGELTGNISTQEVQLRRSVADMKDTLLRARSGASITQQEYTRLRGLVPNITDQPTVFEGKMQGFARAIEQLREAKLRVATTARGTLREKTPEPRALGTPPAAGTAPSTGTKIASQGQIDATLADMNTVRQQRGEQPMTREQVIEALKHKGFTIQP